MQTLLLGILAAICWAIHDLCVRLISQKAAITSSMLTVLGSGALVMIMATLVWGDPHAMDRRAIGLSVASGGLFALAGYGLYRAFALGPVKLVAPVIGAFPIISLGLAMWRGQPVSWDQWIAVIVIVIGVGAVAVFSADEQDSQGETKAILWGIMSGIGFALTFDLGQAAIQSGDELTVITLTRFVALICIFALAVVIRAPLSPDRSNVLVLLGMGLLDAVALSAVMLAGTLPRPEFASVASSLFGLLTVVLAWIILKEKMTAPQWAAVIVAFSGIFWLGQ